MQDYSQLLAGLDVASGVNAIMGAAVLVMGVGFALWLTDTIATWFDSHDDGDEEDEGADVISGLFDGDGEMGCMSCGWYMGDDEEGFSAFQDATVCPKCGE